MTLGYANFIDSDGFFGRDFNDLLTVTTDIEHREYSPENEQRVARDLSNAVYPFWDTFTLAQYLNVSPGLLSAASYINTSYMYRTFYLDKESGKISKYPVFAKSRRIDAPVAPLKELQRRLATAFTVFPAHPANYAFLHNKGIHDALEAIKDSDTIIHVDLKDFFQSHTELYLNSKLAKLIFGVDVLSDTQWGFIRPLVNWMTYKRVLPQGTPTSPILSVVVNYDMDEKLANYAESKHLTYVRYADDLFFGGRIDTIDALDFVDSLQDMVHPFRINHAKVGVMRDSVRPIPTGVIVKLKARRIPPSQSTIICNKVKEITGDQEATVNISDFTLIIKLKSFKNLQLQEATELTTAIDTWIGNRYPALEAHCKTRVFHLANTKSVLGAHIYKGSIKYSRKLYNNMRLRAMLMGMQSAFHYINTEILPCLAITTAAVVDTALREVAEISRESAPLGYGNQDSSLRNLLYAPYSRKQYKGKVNWIRQLQPEKAKALELIECKYFNWTLHKVFTRVQVLGIYTQQAIDDIIRTAVEKYYGNQ